LVARIREYPQQNRHNPYILIFYKNVGHPRLPGWMLGSCIYKLVFASSIRKGSGLILAVTSQKQIEFSFSNNIDACFGAF